MLFQEIIENQSDKENITIYREENKKPPNGEVLFIEIKNNMIIKNLPSSRIWEQRSLAWNVMIQDTLKVFPVKDCKLKINLSDQPRKGHFNLCRPINNNKGYFLLPNFRFTNDNLMHNYIWKRENCDGVRWEDTKSFIFANDTIPFEGKKNMFFYAGSKKGNMRKKYFDFLPDNLNICDGYLWGKELPRILVDINKCGREFLPYSKHFEYKYPMLLSPEDAGTDRARLLLCMNSVPIVHPCPFEEFYSYLLNDNQNYISFTTIEQLKDIIKNRNIMSDKRIIQNNKEFVENVLTYKNILEYNANLLNALNK
tara:strand:- start:51796 stop:52728 length:933 start_codon:yes stop_codon:yes gene_type:complete